MCCVPMRRPRVMPRDHCRWWKYLPPFSEQVRGRAGPESDVGQLTEVLMVLAVTSFSFAEGPVALDELDRPDPLDHLEAELVLDPQPQGGAVQRTQRLVVHLVGQQCLGVHEVRERVAVVAGPPPGPRRTSRRLQPAPPA